MRTWLVYLWDTLRDKLWFIPSLFCLFALVAAVLSLNIDQHFGVDTLPLIRSLQTTGASARIVLGSLIGALVTVVGLAFSLTMLSVSQTASQYGPRLIRSLFDSNVTQNVLGLFLGTIVYSMIVLSSISDLESGDKLFTPTLSIIIAEFLSAICLFGLLTLSNHMTDFMRAETLIRGVYRDALASAEELFPESAASQSSHEISLDPEAQWTEFEDGKELLSKTAGYIQAIDLGSIVAVASKSGHRLKLLKRPGDFVQKNTSLALIDGQPSGPEDDQEGIEQYTGYFMLGSTRTPRQDIEAGVLELVEVGVRALSPGVNDPITAINVIDYLASILRLIASRNEPQAVISDASGTPRVLARKVTFSSVLNCGYDQLRQYSAGSVAVQCRLLEGLKSIAETACCASYKEAIKRQGDMIVRLAKREIHEQNDLEDIHLRSTLLDEVLDE